MVLTSSKHTGLEIKEWEWDWHFSALLYLVTQSQIFLIPVLENLGFGGLKVLDPKGVVYPGGNNSIST